jgi:peptidoglycan/LPS O-acetylase OafA/YrhL
LDGLRGIAAVTVMLFHAELAFDRLGPFSRGYLFVDLFFLLSGFVLALSAEGRLNAKAQSAAQFLVARVRRLWPTVAAGVILGALLTAVPGEAPGLVTLVLLGLAMIPALSSTGEIYPLNGPQWSILLELAANLAHALLLRRLSNAWLLAVVAAAGAALCATIAAYGSNTLGPYAFNWWQAAPRVAFAYPLGIWMARQWARRAPHPRISWRLALILPIAAVIGLTVMPITVAAGDTAVTLVVLPGLFWLATQSEVSAAARGGLEALGRLSFPLYAVHVPILGWMAGFGTSPAMMLLGIACSIAAAQMVALLLSAWPRHPRSSRGVVADLT